MSTYDYAAYDAGREAPGTRALWNVVQAAWPAARFLGIYSRRAIRGSDRLSLHAEGRALDFVPPGGARDTIAAWAVKNANTLGLQEVIVYETRRIWTSPRRDEGWRPYKGVSSGLHHIHLGQHRAGAGIKGNKYDASVMAAALRDAAEESGLRLWQGALFAVTAGGIIALETAFDRGAVRVTKKK